MLLRARHAVPLQNLRRWATAAFEALDGSGAPRIDFYCNEATGEVWLNEVNPCPGSFGYFLWEAANRPAGDGVNFWLKADQELRHQKSYEMVRIG